MLVSRAQLGAAVAGARAKAGMTQAELARRAGLDAFTGRFLKRARKQEKKEGRVGRHLASDTMNYLEVLSI